MEAMVSIVGLRLNSHAYASLNCVAFSFGLEFSFLHLISGTTDTVCLSSWLVLLCSFVDIACTL